MARPKNHPVDALSDDELRALMMRVDVRGFPADLNRLWSVERQRYRQTLRRIPVAAGDGARILDLGSSRPWLPFYQVLLGYRHIVLNTSYPDSGFVRDDLTVTGAPAADVRISVYDVERNRFPHDDDSFDVVTCLEVLEHLAVDPMAMMSEVNRVLKPGAALVLTTPNAVRYSNVVNVIRGEHPYGWAPYNGFDTNRHNREYTPAEVERLLHAAGLNPAEVTTFGQKRRGPFLDTLGWLSRVALLPNPTCPPHWRQDVIIAAGTKISSAVDRRPSWLYFDMAERADPHATHSMALAAGTC